MLDFPEETLGELMDRLSKLSKEYAFAHPGNPKMVDANGMMLDLAAIQAVCWSRHVRRRDNQA